VRNDKRPKYRNRKCLYQGMTFDSKRELSRYLYLLDLQKAGHIKDLQRQVKFVLVDSVRFEQEARRKPAVRYYADAVYTRSDGGTVVEDVKSPSTRKTAAYRLKKALMMSVHGIEIIEVLSATQAVTA
jgi:hypothetical protein